MFRRSSNKEQLRIESLDTEADGGPTEERWRKWSAKASGEDLWRMLRESENPHSPRGEQALDLLLEAVTPALPGKMRPAASVELRDFATA